MGIISQFTILIRQWHDEYLPLMKGVSTNTLSSYKCTWNLMFDFLYSEKKIPSDQINFNMFSMNLLMEFLSWLKKTRSCTDSTRNARLAAIVDFAEFARNRDFNAAVFFYNEVKKIPYVKPSDSNERYALSKEEMQILLSLPSIKDTYGYRDRCILTFLYASGCRGQELCDLKVSDVKFLPDGKTSVRLFGKGRKSRRVRISKEASAILQTYMKRQGLLNQKDAYVFSTQRNPHMSVVCVERIVEKYQKKASALYPTMFKNVITPHVLRHTTATHMLEAGVPIMVICRFLGHANVSTTMIYAKLSEGAVNESLLQWDKKYWNEYMDEPPDDTPIEYSNELQRNRALIFTH